MASIRLRLAALCVALLLVFSVGLTSVGDPDQALHTTAHPSSTSSSLLVHDLLAPDVQAVLLPSTTVPAQTTAAPPPPTPRPSAAPPPKPVEPSAPGDVEAAIQQAFGADAPAAMRVARCESGLNPGAVSKSGTYVGLFQLSGRYHQPRAQRMGFTWAQMTEALPNAQVAADLFHEQGWRPWTCRP